MRTKTTFIPVNQQNWLSPMENILQPANPTQKVFEDGWGFLSCVLSFMCVCRGICLGPYDHLTHGIIFTLEPVWSAFLFSPPVYTVCSLVKRYCIWISGNMS